MGSVPRPAGAFGEISVSCNVKASWKMTSAVRINSSFAKLEKKKKKNKQNKTVQALCGILGSAYK